MPTLKDLADEYSNQLKKSADYKTAQKIVNDIEEYSTMTSDQRRILFDYMIKESNNTEFIAMVNYIQNLLKG